MTTTAATATTKGKEDGYCVLTDKQAEFSQLSQPISWPFARVNKICEQQQQHTHTPTHTHTTDLCITNRYRYQPVPYEPSGC